MVEDDSGLCGTNGAHQLFPTSGCPCLLNDLCLRYCIVKRNFMLYNLLQYSFMNPILHMGFRDRSLTCDDFPALVLKIVYGCQF